MPSTRPLLLPALLALAACNNGQPRIYKIALDKTPETPVLDATCYFNNPMPAANVETTNLRTEEQWVIWDAAATDGSPLEYLDSGDQKAKLGDSPSFEFDSAIETSQPGTFVATTRSELANGTFYTQVRNSTMTVKFSDEGASPTGTMDLHSEYACTPMSNCPVAGPGDDFQTCSVTLNFTARRIDASRVDSYTDTGNAGGP
jgi:hypothetical protein